MRKVGRGLSRWKEKEPQKHNSNKKKKKQDKLIKAKHLAGDRPVLLKTSSFLHLCNNSASFSLATPADFLQLLPAFTIQQQHH